MGLGELVPEADLEEAFIAAGKSAYSAAYLSRYYARCARARVFAEHRRVDLRHSGCAVVSLTASPWSGRQDVLFPFVQSAHPIEASEYDKVLDYAVGCAPDWCMNKVVVSVTDREPIFQACVQGQGFQDASQGHVVITDLMDPVLDDLIEPSVCGLDIMSLDEVSDDATFRRVADFVASNYRTVPMPYEVGPLDPGFMHDEILDEITVKPASMVMHQGGDICGFCHVIDVVGTGQQTEWPIIVVDERLRGQGIGFAASLRALKVSRALGFVRDVSFAAKSNTAVEKQYVGYGGQTVGQYWKYVLEV